MAIYVRNRRCRCTRCRTRGLMGGAILITLGILFLLNENNIYSFDQTWPVLLIVIGLLSFAARSAPSEGHIQPFWMGGSPPPDPGQQNPGGTNSAQGNAGPEVKS